MMRRPMWKIHCMTVLLLTGINIYLLIKLLYCAEKSNDRNRTTETPADGRYAVSATLGWMRPLERREQQQRHPELDVQVKGPWSVKGLQEGSGRPADATVESRPAAAASGGIRSKSFADDKSASESDPVLSGDLLMLGRWDDSRRFVVRDFALAGKQFHSTAVSHNVCLATQSSLDRLHWIGEAADHWRGAISVAVYLDDEEVAIFHRVIRHMRQCHPELLANIAFHVVSASAQSLPPAASAAFSSTFSSSSAFSGKAWTDATSDEGDDGSGGGRTTTANCTGPAEALTWLLKERPSLSAKWESGRPYPQNLMRNVARKGCPSTYVLLLDVDVIPSYNMAESLAEFLDRPTVAAHCPKCAFVVPTYELDYSADFPQNKSQLLALETQGRAQPFHHKAFRYNQFASNLTRWRQTSETDQVVVSHNVTNYEFFYEPFYIARDEAPPHDERFLGDPPSSVKYYRQLFPPVASCPLYFTLVDYGSLLSNLYGFTRNTQVYEMALSGWSFHVLSPIFTIHWGMQMKQRRPAWRKTQMDRNRRLFDVIHQELKAKYGLLNKSPAVRWHAQPLAASRNGDAKQPPFAKAAARTSV